MQHAHLCDDNQIKVPQKIIEQLAIQAGDVLEAEVRSNALVLTVKKQQRSDKVHKMADLWGAAPGAFSTVEEIDAFIREGRDDER